MTADPQQAVAELEGRLIAGLLVEPAACLADVRNILEPAQIESTQERTVFEAMIAVMDRGDVPGIVAVWAEIVSRRLVSLFPPGIAGLDSWTEILNAPLPLETIQLAMKLAELQRQRRAQRAAQAFAKNPTAECRSALEAALGDQQAAKQGAGQATIPVRQLSSEEGEARAVEYFPLLGCEGYVGRALTLLLSSLPKRGKTTLLFWLAHDLIAAGLRVIYLTEESEPVIRERVNEIEGVPLDIFYVSIGRPWSEVSAWLAEQEIDCIIVDTTRAWLDLGRDGENDAGAVTDAIKPLQLATRQRNAALILSHHLRKSGGAEGIAHSGSGAILGIADVGIELHSDRHEPRRRILVAQTRLSATPARMVIELREGAYVALGVPEEEPTPVDALADSIVELLEANPGGTFSLSEMAGALDIDPPPSPTSLLRASHALKDRAKRSGTGTRGDPFRWEVL